MKSKLVIMEHFSTEHTSFLLDFEFTNNITILTGDSGTGKTVSFSFIKESMVLNSDIVCLNYLDYQKDIGNIYLLQKKICLNLLVKRQTVLWIQNYL